MSHDETQTLQVSGMTCGNCVNHVEKALRGTPGVTDAKVDLKRELATVRMKPGVARGALVAAVKEAGYGVKDPVQQAAAESRWKLWKR
ncbi:MAG: heavy-metal-associated domain-containing protein [Thermoplasmatota archaeon]